VLGVGRIKII